MFKRSSIKIPHLLSLLLTSLLLIASHQALAADNAFFDETFGNYQDELETAKEDGKKGVFIFFHMDDCPFCHRMQETFMKDPDVIKLYKDNFITLMHDIEGSNEITDFDGKTGTAQDIAEKKYRVRATPVMMIFDLQGKPMVRYTGPTRTKEEFKWLADYVIDGSYKKQSFTAYKRARKKAKGE